MIPKSQYKEDHGTPYITGEQIEQYHTEQESSSFMNFLSGQTIGQASNGETMFYVRDYERWLRKNKPQENDEWD